jgi:hypothetical protein
MISRDLFIRNLEADAYRENFLVSAVVSIFFIRVFLKLTHYPHLGRGDFHVAHMLFGGFFMMMAIFILLSFFSKRSATLASILGGIGFGTFIDELGKFITSDNDYFFQPTIALIYIIFVLLYLISKFIPHYQAVSKKEYLVNAIELIKESAVNDYDMEEEKRAISYLRHCDPKDPIVVLLSKVISSMEATPAQVGIYTRFRVFLRSWYYKVARSGFVLNAIIVYLAVETLRTFFESASFFMTRPVLPFREWGQLYSSVLAGCFVLIGLAALRFSKYEAFRFFRISMLITILMTDFFVFMRSQWYGLIGLIINIFMLLVINYAMYREKNKAKQLRVEH